MDHWLKAILGIFCILVGLALTVTIIGAIIGVPMMAVGVYLLYKAQAQRMKGIVKAGVEEALKSREKEMKEEVER